jgi:hypothetical protein
MNRGANHSGATDLNQAAFGSALKTMMLPEAVRRPLTRSAQIAIQHEFAERWSFTGLVISRNRASFENPRKYGVFASTYTTKWDIFHTIPDLIPDRGQVLGHTQVFHINQDAAIDRGFNCTHVPILSSGTYNRALAVLQPVRRWLNVAAQPTTATLSVNQHLVHSTIRAVAKPFEFEGGEGDRLAGVLFSTFE